MEKHKKPPQNEKDLLLSKRKGLRLLNNPFSLINQSVYLCKSKAQFENMFLSICRATDRIYSIMIHKTAHETVSKYLLLCDVVVILWTIIE